MRAFAAIGSDLVITAADGSALTPGVDYDYYISSVTNPVTQVSADIGTLNVYTNTPVVIKNADGVSSTQDIIVINASYADVTLAGVNISYPSMWTDSSALCIANDNTASITLADGTTNTLISDSMYGCGIAKDGTGTLTITCEKAKNDFSHKCDENCGTLSAKANMYGSAIGSTSGQYNGKTAQKITILGGNITAASKHGAAIGGGIYTGAENITVSGGNINATGGGSSAAIGSGEKNSSSSEAVTAENIKILGGNINAVGGFGAAAIGGGKESSASDITIANANVKAVTDDYSAAIGGGQNANGKNIRIENSTLYAASQSGAAIIGGGVDGTGDKIYIENSVVSLVQKGSCGPDMIGNGVASEIYIDNSSVAMYSTNTVSPDISQNSQIKNSAGEPVYLLTVDNPNGDDVIVDGVMAIAANNIAADPSDTGLHLWLADRDHSLEFADANGATTQIDYHFNDLFKVFNLCEADIDNGYHYNETAHWYICKNSDLCTVKFNYQEHFGGNATCTNKAVCEACGVEYGDPLGHNMQYFDYVPETCTTDGNIEYYKCGNCSKLFTDADGKNEITYADTVIAAKGHRYLTSWTFDSDSHWHKCDVCGSVDKIEPHVSSGHATETAAETCTICGYEIAPVLGHIHANNLMPVYAVKPTCTKDGNIGYYVCSCGKMFADSNAATALTEADIVIPAAGHGATEIRNRVEPTETANGYTGDEYCTVCNELVKRGTVIPATASSGTTTTTPSEPTSAPSGTTTTPSEPTSALTGTTTTPSEPTSALTGTTTTLSEPTSALTGTTTTPSEPTSALTGTTTTPSETTSAQSGTTTIPSETSATTTLPPEDAELPFIKDEGGRVIVDENDHAADNESGDAEKSENDETNPVTGAAVAGLIALIIPAAAVAVVLSRKKK